MQMTERDEAMLAWLSLVRIADMSALRFALAGLAGASEPVSERRVRQWVARLVEMGLLERERISLRGGIRSCGSLGGGAGRSGRSCSGR